jgi:hypothetical protein
LKNSLIYYNLVDRVGINNLINTWKEDR